jgi:hypothetical protein
VVVSWRTKVALADPVVGIGFPTATVAKVKLAADQSSKVRRAFMIISL